MTPDEARAILRKALEPPRPLSPNSILVHLPDPVRDALCTLVLRLDDAREAATE
jgi:hypothetical protein